MNISEINLNRLNNNKKKDYLNRKSKEEIQNFYQKKILKTTLLNIDSRYRNKTPKTIYTSNLKSLPLNPITVFSDSYLVKINFPKHKLNIGDRIVIHNIIGNTKTLTSNCYFFDQFNYLIVYFPNHQITNNYLTYINEFYTILDSKDDITNLQFYENIPINSIYGLKKIIISSDITNIPTNLISELNITNDELEKNYFFIKLPYDFTISDRTSSSSLYTLNQIFKISFTNIGGIPLQYLNADYPINYKQYQGFHEIINIDIDNIYINVRTKAFQNYTFGGSNVKIHKINQIYEGYPNSNEYKIYLKHNFNNVTQIELLSMEIPFIDFIVKSKGNNINNKLYWQHYDDGNYVYNLEIPEGNYDGTTLISKISEKINTIERISSTLKNQLYNQFEIDFNTFSQEIKIYAYKDAYLPNSLYIIKTVINNETFYELIITDLRNLVEVNDIITISNAEKIPPIPKSAINQSHTVYSVNKISGTYSVLLKPLNETLSSSGIISKDDGGNSIKIKTRAKVRFLFNKSDTLGNILGFKNVGQDNAITDFNHITSNFDDYIYPNKYDEVGNINNDNNILNLTGNNFYLLMHLNNYESIISNSNINSCFSKILLTGSPGDVLFNTFINNPVIFNIPLSTLSELYIKFTYPDGTFPDFRNLNHSFTLKITELISTPIETGINSNKTSFFETTKQINI